MLRSGNRFAKSVVDAVVEMTEENTRSLERQLVEVESALSKTHCHFSDLWWQAVPLPLRQRLRDTEPGDIVVDEDFDVSVIYAKYSLPVAWPCRLLKDIDCFFDQLVENYDAFRIHAISGDIVVICGFVNSDNCAVTAATIAGALHRCVASSQRQNDPDECGGLQIGICNGTMHIAVVSSTPPRCNYLGRAVDNARELCEFSQPGFTLVNETFRQLVLSLSSPGVHNFKFNATKHFKVDNIATRAYITRVR